MKNPQIQVLIETIESVHGMVVWYSSFLKDTDKDKCFEINGKKLNSLYWLVAHIANTEDELLMKALGQKGHQYKWLSEYTFGSAQNIEGQVSYKELVAIAKQIHIDCINFLKTLSDEDLENDNVLNISFGNSKSFKTIIMHHIRHEGVHAGHLSLLCKLNGIKTV